MPIPKTRKSRKDSRYSREEMQVISKYKQEYREQTTRELRGNVFKAKILVDLFNLWLEEGKAPDTEEDSANRMKVTQNIGGYNGSLPHCLLFLGACYLGPEQLAPIVHHVGNQSPSASDCHKCCLGNRERGS
jgi:hypothetical protein